jgi:hypothetical protein
MQRKIYKNAVLWDVVPCRSYVNRIQFHNTSILATKTRYVYRIVREAIEIELHPNNMNRLVGFILSKSWKPLICSLKKLPEHDARPAGQIICNSPDILINFE